MRKDLLLVSLLVVVLGLMVVPLATSLIDALLTFSISLAVLLLMASVYVRKTYEFSTLPAIILIATIFRLALSIATTRSILTEAEAGDIIATFGDFVVGGSIAIGLVIFLIITVVQFLVVTKGAERVAEVGARFALDALPGKQMSIDADMRVGVIDQDEAHRQRGQLDQESRFFGAMDGAMKFVKGDAIAGLAIIVINLIGGIAVGVTLHGLSIADAIAVFSLLTVGDGLVAQIPALFIALAAGILVTRIDAGEQHDLGTRIADQLVADPRVLGTASAVILGLGFVPGLPWFIFAIAASLLAGSAAMMHQALKRRKAEEEALETQKGAESPPGSATAKSSRFVLRLGTELISESELEAVQATLSEKFAQLSETYGLTLLPAQCRFAPEGHPRDVSVELDDVPIHRDTVPEDSTAIRILGDLPETPVGAPIRLGGGNPRLVWVRHEELNDLKVEFEQFSLEEFLTKISLHAYERHRAAMLSMSDVKALMDKLSERQPHEVAVIRKSQNDAGLFEIIHQLFSDGVPLRPFGLFAENFARIVQGQAGLAPGDVADQLRVAMRRQYCRLLAGANNLMGVVLLDPSVEADVRREIQAGKGSGAIAPGSELSDCLSAGARHFLSRAQDARPVMVVAGDVRAAIKEHLGLNGLDIPVLAPHDLSVDARCVPIGRITGKRANA